MGCELSWALKDRVVCKMLSLQIIAEQIAIRVPPDCSTSLRFLKLIAPIATNGMVISLFTSCK